MKETQQQHKDQTVIEKQAEINKGLKYMGSQRMKPGHTMFEYNVRTGELTIANITTGEAVLNKDGSTTVRRKLETKKDCQYFPSLNRKNATKKLNNLGFNVMP